MQITATNYPLTVQYKQAGKSYQLGNDSNLTDSFDEKYLTVGESFDVTGQLIAIHEHTGTSNVDFAPVGQGGNGSDGS